MIYVLVENDVVTNRILFDADMPPEWPNYAQWQQNDVAQMGWILQGGALVEPPPVPLTPEQQAAKDAAVAKKERLVTFNALLDTADLIQRLKAATPAQIDSWVDTNVTNLADARTVLKAIVKVMATQL